MSEAIDLAGFAKKFRNDADPWRTFASRDEAVKRAAILTALGPGPIGRVLELASGNGSNSVAIARRSLRLDATEGTQEGTALTARALAPWPRARATVLALPGRFPHRVYDAIVIAELLYYLSPGDMAAVAVDSARALRPGGRLILAHHRIDFYDFVQHAEGIHDRFVAAFGQCMQIRDICKNRRWSVAVVR